MTIPKIVHQTAPTDRNKWHSSWAPSQATWKKYFPEPEYKHVMWSDNDLRRLVQTHYGWFLETYDAYPSMIMRIDMGRVFVLHRYGGIYADMDFECLGNFYTNLPPDRPSIVESPYKHNERHQNSLMASPPNHVFWIELAKAAKVAYTSRSRILMSLGISDVLDMTGPVLLDNVISASSTSPHVLRKEQYNPWHDGKTGQFQDYGEKVYARHHNSKMWHHPTHKMLWCCCILITLAVLFATWALVLKKQARAPKS